MNPNDPWIQIRWASLQGSLGRPERGLPAAEIAFRLNPRHPRLYKHFLSRFLFQLRRYAEAATSSGRASRSTRPLATCATWPGERRPTAIWVGSRRHSTLRRNLRRGSRSLLAWRSWGRSERVRGLGRRCLVLCDEAEDEERLRDGLRRAAYQRSPPGSIALTGTAVALSSSLYQLTLDGPEAIHQPVDFDEALCSSSLGPGDLLRVLEKPVRWWPLG